MGHLTWDTSQILKKNKGQRLVLHRKVRDRSRKHYVSASILGEYVCYQCTAIRDRYGTKLVKYLEKIRDTTTSGKCISVVPYNSYWVYFDCSLLTAASCCWDLSRWDPRSRRGARISCALGPTPARRRRPWLDSSCTCNSSRQAFT